MLGCDRHRVVSEQHPSIHHSFNSTPSAWSSAVLPSGSQDKERGPGHAEASRREPPCVCKEPSQAPESTDCGVKGWTAGSATQEDFLDRQIGSEASSILFPHDHNNGCRYALSGILQARPGLSHL